MRGISAHTSTFYHGLFQTIVYAIVVLATREGLAFVRDFNIYDYLLLTSSAAFAMVHQIFRQLAVKYDTASRVTIYNYMQSVI